MLVQVSSTLQTLFLLCEIFFSFSSFLYVALLLFRETEREREMWALFLRLSDLLHFQPIKNDFSCMKSDLHPKVWTGKYLF